MAVHELKCWPEYFDAILSGEKTFEVRRDDRGFQRGDIIELLKCERQRIGGPAVITDLYGKPMYVQRFRIGWILTGGQFGIEPGYIVFSLEKIDA
jgi:hypothetical protein